MNISTLFNLKIRERSAAGDGTLRCGYLTDWVLTDWVVVAPGLCWGLVIRWLRAELHRGNVQGVVFDWTPERGEKQERVRTGSARSAGKPAQQSVNRLLSLSFYSHKCTLSFLPLSFSWVFLTFAFQGGILSLFSHLGPLSVPVSPSFVWVFRTQLVRTALSIPQSISLQLHQLSKLVFRWSLQLRKYHMITPSKSPFITGKCIIWTRPVVPNLGVKTK